MEFSAIGSPFKWSATLNLATSKNNPNLKWHDIGQLETFNKFESIKAC